MSRRCQATTIQAAKTTPWRARPSPSPCAVLEEDPDDEPSLTPPPPLVPKTPNSSGLEPPQGPSNRSAFGLCPPRRVPRSANAFGLEPPAGAKNRKPLGCVRPKGRRETLGFALPGTPHGPRTASVCVLSGFSGCERSSPPQNKRPTGMAHRPRFTPSRAVWISPSAPRAGDFSCCRPWGLRRLRGCSALRPCLGRSLSGRPWCGALRWARAGLRPPG